MSSAPSALRTNAKRLGVWHRRPTILSLAFLVPFVISTLLDSQFHLLNREEPFPHRSLASEFRPSENHRTRVGLLRAHAFLITQRHRVRLRSIVQRLRRQWHLRKPESDQQ